jgi:hypothetical protein
MNSLEASGEGWSAASARTLSRQYVEQKLLVDVRRPSAPDPGIVDTGVSPSLAWQNEQRN